MHWQPQKLKHIKKYACSIGRMKNANCMVCILAKVYYIKLKWHQCYNHLMHMDIPAFLYIQEGIAMYIIADFSAFEVIECSKKQNNKKQKH